MLMTRPDLDPKSNRAWSEVQAEGVAERAQRGSFGWYIVHLVGKSDQHAIDWLKRLKVDFYNPMVREMRPLPRKKMSHKQRASGLEIKKPQVVPLFPRYMFVRFDMGKHGWREIFDFAGIGGMVSSGNLPVWVPNDLIVSIQAQAGDDGILPGHVPAASVFKQGDHVLVVDGPFASFDAIVEYAPEKPLEDIDPEDRIKVAINIFGRSTPMTLEVSQVEKI